MLDYLAQTAAEHATPLGVLIILTKGTWKTENAGAGFLWAPLICQETGAPQRTQLS